MVEVKIKESDERYMIIISWEKKMKKKRKLTQKNQNNEINDWY